MGPNQGVDFGGIMAAIKVADQAGDVNGLTALSGMLKALGRAASKAADKHCTVEIPSQGQLWPGSQANILPPTTGGAMKQPDRWLTAKQAAAMTGWVAGQGGGMTPRWFYEHHSALAFGKRIGSSVRFLESGVLRLMRDGL